MTRKEVRQWCFFGLMEVLWLLFLHLEKIAQLFPRYMAGISPRFFYVAAVLCLMGGDSAVCVRVGENGLQSPAVSGGRKDEASLYHVSHPDGDSDFLVYGIFLC